jgi:hypothetical protein
VSCRPFSIRPLEPDYGSLLRRSAPRLGPRRPPDRRPRPRHAAPEHASPIDPAPRLGVESGDACSLVPSNAEAAKKYKAALLLVLALLARRLPQDRQSVPDLRKRLMG